MSAQNLGGIITTQVKCYVENPVNDQVSSTGPRSIPFLHICSKEGFVFYRLKDAQKAIVPMPLKT